MRALLFIGLAVAGTLCSVSGTWLALRLLRATPRGRTCQLTFAGDNLICARGECWTLKGPDGGAVEAALTCTQ